MARRARDSSSRTVAQIPLIVTLLLSLGLGGVFGLSSALRISTAIIAQQNARLLLFTNHVQHLVDDCAWDMNYTANYVAGLTAQSALPTMPLKISLRSADQLRAMALVGEQGEVIAQSGEFSGRRSTVLTHLAAQPDAEVGKPWFVADSALARDLPRGFVMVQRLPENRAGGQFVVFELALHEADLLPSSAIGDDFDMAALVGTDGQIILAFSPMEHSPETEFAMRSAMKLPPPPRQPGHTFLRERLTITYQGDPVREGYAGVHSEPGSGKDLLVYRKLPRAPLYAATLVLHGRMMTAWVNENLPLWISLGLFVLAATGFSRFMALWASRRLEYESQLEQTTNQLTLQAKALESVNSGIIITGVAKDGFPTRYVNKAFTRITGFEPEDVLGRNSAFLQRRDDASPAYLTLCRALREETSATAEVDSIRKDGTVFLGRTSLSPVILNSGEGASHFVGIIDDVTAERAAAMRLRQQALVLETIDDTVIMIAPDMRIISYNRAAGRMFGSHEDVTGKSIWELNFAKNIPSNMVKASQRAFAENRVWRAKLWINDAAGERRLHDVTASPVYDNTGAFIGHVAVGRDRTEEWHAESRLRLHALIMEQMKDGVVVYDQSGLIIECNQALLDMMRWPREVLVGCDGSRFAVDPAAALADHDARLREMDEAGLSVRERAMMRGDGSVIYVENSKFPLRNETGAVVGYVMVVRDMSTPREAERRYQRSQSLYAGLVESALDAIISVDERHRILVFNHAAESMFHCAAVDAIGQPLTNFLPAYSRDVLESLDSISAGRRRAMKGSGDSLRTPNDATGRRADGAEFPIDASISHVQTDDGLVFTAIVRDLTETRAIENQLRQSEKMQAVGQLSGGIAHDINNLLSVIGTSVELALEYPEDEEQSRLALMRAGRGVDSAANLVEKLLTFSRKGGSAPKIGRVEDIVWDVMPVLLRTLPENINIRANIAEQLPLVAFDQTQFESALLNLAINARDAMGDGGDLTIGVRAVAAPAASVEVTVADTGCGMPPDICARAIEPFFTTKAAGLGTGLGLSMVYSMMEQSLGRLDIQSAEGRGTTIRLVFPVAEGMIEVESDQSEDLIHGRGEIVLIVEDHEDLRQSMMEQVRSLGYAPLEAMNCSDALDMIGSGTPIEVLLSDVIMNSDMNGKDLAQRACALRPDLHVILCTGYSSTVLDTGVDPNWQVLRKPLKRHHIAFALARALGPINSQDLEDERFSKPAA